MNCKVHFCARSMLTMNDCDINLLILLVERDPIKDMGLRNPLIAITRKCNSFSADFDKGSKHLKVFLL